MVSLLPVLIPVVFVSLIVALFVVAHRAAKKRTEAWHKAAAELGLAYFGQQNTLQSRFAHLRVLHSGHRPRVTEGITGDTGDTEITIADFEYTSSSTDSDGKDTSTTHRYTLCIVAAATLNLSPCSLEPKVALFNFLRKMFGGKEVCIAEDQEFLKAFVLRGGDEEAVRRQFTPEVRAWFCDRRKRGLHFEGGLNSFVFYGPNRVDPRTAKELLGEGLELMKLLSATGTG